MVIWFVDIHLGH